MNLLTSNTGYYIIVGVLFLLLILVCTLVILFLNQRKKVRQLENILSRHPEQVLQKHIEIEELDRQKISNILKNTVSGVYSTQKQSPAYNNIPPARKTTIHYHPEGNMQNDKLVSIVLGISDELHSNVIRQFGFYEAIKHFTTKITDGTGIVLEFQLDSMYQKQREETEITIYRIYQELIRNIMKHSEPEMLAITTDMSANELELMLLHDGVGISQQAYESILEKSSAFGLRNIHNRLALLEGRIEFQYKNGIQKIFLRVPVTC